LFRFSAGRAIRISPPELRPAILSKRSLSAKISGRIRRTARITNVMGRLWLSYGLVHPAGKVRGVPGQDIRTEVIDRRYAVFDRLSANETS